jgi:hypothetical protein
MKISDPNSIDTICTANSIEGPAFGAGAKSDPRTVRLELRIYLDLAFLIVMLCMVASTSINPRNVADPDLWWHLRAGNWILQHGGTPAHEMFSGPAMGKPWVAYSWLFEVLTAKLFEFWGLRGIMALSALLVVAGCAALTALLARYTHLIRAMMVALAAHIPMLVLATPRPWLFTILFFTVEFWLLLEASDRCRPAWLIPVVPLMLIWANVHIQFIYGLALIGVFALQQTFPGGSRGLLAVATKAKLSAKWLWALLGMAALASLVNPYGWRLYLVVYQYATETVPFTFIQEFQALQFRDLPSWGALGLVSGAWFVLGGTRKKSAWLLVLMAASCACGFRMIRDIWFPLIVSAVVLANGIRPRRVSCGSLAGGLGRLLF